MAVSRRRLIRASALAAPWIFLPRLANSSIHGSITNGLTINKLFDTNTGSRASPGSAFGGNATIATQFFDACDRNCAYISSRLCTNTKTTITIQFGYGTCEDIPLNAGENGANVSNFINGSLSPNVASYSTIKAAIAAKVRRTNSINAIATWPASEPGTPANQDFLVTEAQALQLGIAPSGAYPHAVQSFIGIGTTLQTRDGIWLHELREALGEVRYNGRDDGLGTFIFTPLDMLAWKSPGVNAYLSQAVGNYFSIDSGVTNGIGSENGVLNTTSDSGDWDGSRSDCCNWNSNGLDPFTNIDFETLDCGGWQWNGSL